MYLIPQREEKVNQVDIKGSTIRIFFNGPLITVLK